MVAWPLYRLVGIAATAPLVGGLLGCQTIFGIDAAPGGDGGGGGGSDVCGDGVCSKSENCLECAADCARASCDDNLEVNDQSLQATDLDSSHQRCGLGICASDADWFALDVPPDTQVRIRYDASQGDLDLEIYDPEYVDGSYTAGIGEDKVPLGNLPPGPYLARVYGKGDDETIENTCYCIKIATGE